MRVYRITNSVNGKCYIGQTINTAERRWKQHLVNRISSTPVLKAAIAKYGAESFSIETLVEAHSQAALDTLEILCIKKYNTQVPNGYNISPGGSGAGAMADSTKEKLRVSTGKLWEDSEYIANHGAGMKRYWSDPKHREECSEARKGSGNSFYGKKHSDETRAKLRAAKIGKPAEGRNTYIKATCQKTGEVTQFRSIGEAENSVQGKFKTNLWYYFSSKYTKEYYKGYKWEKVPK